MERRGRGKLKKSSGPWTKKLKKLNNTGMKEDVKAKDKDMIMIATWNVQGTFETGALKNLAEVFQKYGINIAALQETKQKGNIIIQIENYILFNSGGENRMLGAGFMIHRNLQNLIVKFDAINERMCVIRFRGRYRKITIVNAHAPTEEKEEDEKDKFYEVLEKIIEKIPIYDIKIVLGDFNAKVGRENMYKNVTGGNSKHLVSNENGVKLIQFAVENDMTIMSTFFNRKDIYKGTWISPDGRTVNQIDHMLIENRHVKSVKNTRSYRGANAESDHFMVRTKMCQELPKKTANTNKRRRKYDIQKMHIPEIKHSFEVRIEEKLREKLGTDEIEEEWQFLEKSIQQVANSLIPYGNSTKDKNWCDEECKIAIQQRNKARMEMLTKRNEASKTVYSEKRKEVKRLCRKKKREGMEQRISKIENHFINKEIRNFYQEAKKQKSTGTTRTIFCKSKEGRLLGGTEEKLNRWKEHFEEVLNEEGDEENSGEDEDALENINVEHQILNIEAVPDEEEISMVIDRLGNNKSPGENGIAAEILKLGGDTLREKISVLIQRIWEEEVMPACWTEVLLCPVYKKGDRAECQNYRGIALQDVTYKLLAMIIRNRLKNAAERIVGEYQCGFRENRSVNDQIFILKQIMNSSHEYELPLCLLFIDFKQAYDRVKRGRLFEVMETFGIPSKIINLVKLSLECTKCKILLDGKISDGFDINRGLRQGDPLSPILFNLILERIMRDSKIRTKGLIYHHKHQCMAYADDIVLVTRSKHELKEIFVGLERTARKFGLIINEEKTKYMDTTNDQKVTGFKVYTHDKEYGFERVQSFNYLGVIITEKSEEKDEIQNRLAKGSKSAGALSRLLKSKQLTRQAKIKLYETVIRPTVLYGCETWILTKNLEESLEVWERKMLRKIYGGVKEGEMWRRRTNEELTELYRREKITTAAKKQRLRWLGHLYRLPKGRASRAAMETQGGSKRRRGRPRRRWMGAVCEDLRRFGVVNWKESATDRKKWREIVKALGQ